MGTKGQVVGGVVSFADPTIDSTSKTGVWADCPLLEFQHNPTIGHFYREDWNEYVASASEWVLTQATTGTAAMSTAEGGVLELDSNSSTVTQGATLQRDNCVWVPAASQHIWAEFEFKVVDAAVGAELFVGLSEVDTTLIAASANSSANHIGWQCVTDDGVLLFTAEKAGAGATKAATTLVEATYVRLGFKCTGVTSIQQYINGVAVGTAHATANVPIVKLVPSFVCQSEGTTDPIMHIRSFQIFQLRP